MNKFKFYFIVSIIAISLFSCHKDNPTPVEPPRDYQTQYDVDIAAIEEFLTTNYITVTDHPGFVDDQDVVIKKIDNGQPSIMSYLDAPTYPKLLVRNVSQNNIIYKLYYLVLRPGVGESPCNVDGVLASYRGDYLERDATTTIISPVKFEEVIYPQTMLSLFSTISGWSEVFPIFKTGTNTINPDGTVTHNDFGAGVMFLPSGLGYYNTGSGSIPSYSPLVFSFKLYNLERLDQDGDGVLSYQEDIDGDGYVYNYKDTFKYPVAPADEIRYADDTDKDGIANFVDVDDDGDNYTTKLEIKNPATGLPYPFADIPTCASGKKNYLDATCHP